MRFLKTKNHTEISVGESKSELGDNCTTVDPGVSMLNEIFASSSSPSLSLRLGVFNTENHSQITK